MKYTTAISSALANICSLSPITSKQMAGQKTKGRLKCGSSWEFLWPTPPSLQLMCAKVWGTSMLSWQGWNIYGTRKSKPTPKTQKLFVRDLFHASTQTGFRRAAYKTELENKWCKSVLETHFSVASCFFRHCSFYVHCSCNRVTRAFIKCCVYFLLFPTSAVVLSNAWNFGGWLQTEGEDGAGCSAVTAGRAAVPFSAWWSTPPRLILIHFQRLWFLQWRTECSQERSQQFQCQDRSGFISTSLELVQKVKEQYIPVSIQVIC